MLRSRAPDSAALTSVPEGSVADVGYREFSPPSPLRDLVETAWVMDGPGDAVRVLPDGCMDLISMNGRIVVAGPDTTASLSPRGAEPFAGLRFRPGILPRLLGVPAAALRNQRVSLDELKPVRRHRGLADVAARLAAARPARETAPWSLPTLHHVTRSLAAGASVGELARDLDWSDRHLQRQCGAVYGYGPATLRRILRFRRAMRLAREGRSFATVAADTGYADQPHLHREVRALSGVPLRSLLAAQDGNGANRSTDVPSGSWTVAYRCPHGASNGANGPG
jgi:AraC-like DNA-binding protein